MSAVHIIFICFIPFMGTMNSINWPAPNVWVFLAQLVKHCSAYAEAMGWNPVETPKTFFGLTLRLLKSNRFDKSKLDWLIHFFGWAANQRKSRRLAESNFLFPTYLGRSKESTRRHIQHNESTRIPRNTHNFLIVLKKCHVPGAIGFSFASHWLQNRLLTVIWKLL